MDCKEFQDQVINQLLDDSEMPIHPEIVEHLNQCQVCIREIRELKTVDRYFNDFIGQLPVSQIRPRDGILRVYRKIQSKQQRFKKYLIYKTGMVAAVVLIGLFSFFSLTTPQGRVLEGTLYVERVDEGEVIVSKGALSIGQVLKTKEGQSAKIKLRDGSVLKMMPGTLLTLDDDRLLNLEEGELHCQVAKGGGFVINMPGAELKTLGTEFDIRMSTNRKKIITSQNKPLSFIISATVKVAVATGRVALTTGQEHKRLYQEVGPGETVIREIDPPLPVELQTEIKDLIQQLGNENKAIQGKAFELLLKIGFSVVPFLEGISLSDNSPIKVQISRLREKFPRPEILWSHEIPRVGFALHPPVVSGNQLYVVSESGLYALDWFTGEVKWELEQNGFNSAPLLKDSIIYIGTLGGSCLAIESKTGQVIWQRTGLGPIQSVPAFFNGTLYLGSNQSYTTAGNFYALDAATGKIQWGVPTQGMVIRSQASVFNDELVLFGDWRHKLYALHPRTGKQIWSYQTKGIIVTTPLVANDTVYLGAGDSNIYALSLPDGQKQWVFQSDSEVIESPIKAGNILYWGTKHKIYAFDLVQHTVLWTYNRERYIIGTMAVEKERVYLGTDSGRIIALHAQTGEETWNYDLTKELSSYRRINSLTNYLVSSPTLYNDILYCIFRGVGDSVIQEQIYALKLK